MTVDPLARLAMAEAALDKAANLVGLMRERAEEAEQRVKELEAERNEWEARSYEVLAEANAAEGYREQRDKLRCSCQPQTQLEPSAWNPDCPQHGMESDWYEAEQARRKAEAKLVLTIDERNAIANRLYKIQSELDKAWKKAEAAQARIAALEGEVELLGDSAELAKELEAERDNNAAWGRRGWMDYESMKGRAEKAEAEAARYRAVIERIKAQAPFQCSSSSCSMETPQCIFMICKAAFAAAAAAAQELNE